MANGRWTPGEGMLSNAFFGGRYTTRALKLLPNHVPRDSYLLALPETERRAGRWETLGTRVTCTIYIKFCNSDLNKNSMPGFRHLKLVHGSNKEPLLTRNGFHLCRPVIWEGLQICHRCCGKKIFPRKQNAQYKSQSEIYILFQTKMVKIWSSIPFLMPTKTPQKQYPLREISWWQWTCKKLTGPTRTNWWR